MLPRWRSGNDSILFYQEFTLKLEMFTKAIEVDTGYRSCKWSHSLCLAEHRKITRNVTPASVSLTLKDFSEP